MPAQDVTVPPSEAETRRAHDPFQESVLSGRAQVSSRGSETTQHLASRNGRTRDSGSSTIPRENISQHMATTATAHGLASLDSLTSYAAPFWIRHLEMLDSVGATLLGLCPQSCILSKLARRLGDTGQTWRKFGVVLSIWPSSSRPACRGWVARCQIWSIEGSPVQAADIRILCNPDEIWLVVVSRLSISEEAAFAIIDDTIAPLYPSTHPRPVLNLAAGDLHDTSNRPVSPDQRSSATSRTPFRPGEMIHATVSSTTAPQSGPAALPASSSSVVTLEVATYGGGGERDILGLLAPPRWHGLNHTFAIVQLPQDQSSMLRVLLYMAPAPSYDMSPPPPGNNSTHHHNHHHQVAYPMVIDRHVGAIRRAAGNTSNTQPAADTRRLQVVRDNMGLIERPDSPLPVDGLEIRTDMGRADTGSRDEEDL
ncbi:hypothetical protein B0T26DRAFT_682132 [Lasiosphaeria miniovina]|uniref:Uncharacterized protein n=1 Tax=Lasiosphaeria miniovina TaxID=1954250 RepID=A0AA39ZQY2_9PEZI|nr:uncharacterized protein B0T26DRAFT_682132 [Lasiosphaeria miniovina]KAK0702059.1 hypothetical protein B0T26DRAFT_682132 [Lasiosphaeria miniovina]